MVEYDSADRSLQQCLHILGGSVASAADSGRGDTNSAHSAQSEDSPDRQRRDADEFYDDVTADDEVVTAVTTAAPAQSQPPQQRQTGEDVEFGRQKLLRTSTRTKKSSGGGAAGRQDQLAREALSLPLSRWRAEHVAAWAASPTVGLAIYAERLQATVKSGDILARLTDSDMQRELAIQEPLHRRRLRLAIDRLTSPDSRAPQPAPSLDCVWLASQLLPSLGLRQLADQFRCAMVDCSLLLTLDKADLKGSQLAVRQRRYRRSLALGVALLRYVRLDWDKLVAIRQKFASNLLLYWSANCLHSWLLLWGAPVSEDRVLESGLHGAYLESLAQCDRPPQPASAASAADAASSTGGSTVSSTADLSAAPSTNNGSSQQQPKQKQQQVKQRSPSPPPPPPTQQQKKPIKPVPPVPASRASLLGGGAGGGEFRRAFRRELSSVSSAEHQQQQQKQQQQPPQAHARLSLRGGGVGISTAMPPPIAAPMSRLPMLLASACGVQLFKRSFAAAAASGSFTGRIPIKELHIREGCSVNGRPLSDSPSGSTARRLKPRLVQLYSDRISRDGQFVVASDRLGSGC
uniref:SAM domain-containing protein n=1 Tax=Macrostomum lignano TaxID=282301 RepID=A0A1I8F2F6_9PLAT